MLEQCRNAAGAARNRARESFYGMFWNKSFAVAKGMLAGLGWKGDRVSDAEDVASKCSKLLVNQEKCGSGPFKHGLTGDSLRRYLVTMIKRGCKQQIWRTKPSCADESLDAVRQDKDGEYCLLDKQVDECLEDTEIRRRLSEEIAALKEVPRGYYRKLPAGVTPLDCVLNVELGRLLEKRMSLRTIQRYSKQAREGLAGRLGIELNSKGRAIGHRAGRRRRQDPEMGI